VKDFNIAETEEDISTYAGYVGKICVCSTMMWWIIYMFLVVIMWWRKHCRIINDVW